MLFSARFVTIVRDVPLHVFVETSEAVTERSILNALLVRDNVVVESFEAGYRVNDEVSIAGN